MDNHIKSDQKYSVHWLRLNKKAANAVISLCKTFIKVSEHVRSIEKARSFVLGRLKAQSGIKTDADRAGGLARIKDLSSQVEALFFVRPAGNTASPGIRAIGAPGRTSFTKDHDQAQPSEEKVKADIGRAARWMGTFANEGELKAIVKRNEETYDQIVQEIENLKDTK